MKLFFLKIIRFYQTHISFFFGKACRFSPTCSEYTYQAIQRYGIIYGSWLGAKRIIRCHPWNRGGYDPIPKHV